MLRRRPRARHAIRTTTATFVGLTMLALAPSMVEAQISDRIGKASGTFQAIAERAKRAKELADSLKRAARPEAGTPAAGAGATLGAMGDGRSGSAIVARQPPPCLAAITSPEVHPVTVPPCADLDLAAVLAMRDAVAKRVLHERLQDEVGHQHPHYVVIHLPAYPQPVGEAHLFDLEILARERQLLRERNLVNVPCLEHASQHVAQARDQLHGDVRLPFPHKHRDGVERIEQEVRVQLHPERLQLRARCASSAAVRRAFSWLARASSSQCAPPTRPK